MALGNCFRGVLALWLASCSLLAAAQEFPTTQEVIAGHAATLRGSLDVDTSALTATLVPGGAVQRAALAVPSAVKSTSVASQRVWVGFGNGAVASLVTGTTHPELEFAQPSVPNQQPRPLSLLHVHGDRLYVADTNHSIWVRDAKTGTSLSTQPIFATSSSVIDIQANDTTLFVALADGTLWSIDVTKSDTPTRLAQLTLPHSPRRLALSGNWLCVADKEGVSVIDVSARGALSLLHVFPVPAGGVYDLALKDSLVLAAAGEQGVLVLDLTERGVLEWRGSHQAAGDVRRIVSNGDLTAAATLRGEVLVFDVSMPNMPSITHALPEQEPVESLAFVDSTLVIAGSKALSIWDVSAMPPRLSNDALNAGEGINFGGQRKGQLLGNRLYVADWFSGLHIYDVSFPNQPRLLSSYHTPGSPKGVVVKNDIAYIADDDHGLQVINVSNPLAPMFVAALQTEGLAYTPVIAEDGKLYLASHRGGFQIIDITRADMPRLLGQVDTPGKAWSIAVAGHVAYVADSESGLLIFDVQNSAEPVLLGQFSPGGNAEDVWVEGNTAYVAFFDDGLYELDISDPKTPQIRAHLATPGNARGLEKVGDQLFIADWFGGLQVVDVKNPGRPQLRATYDTPGAAWGLRVTEKHAFVFDWWGGLLVLDITDPLHPHALGDYNQSTRIRALAARGRYVYAAQGERGLQVFDINNPLNPTWTTGLELPGFAHDVALAQDRALVATGDKGLVMVDVSDPFQPRIIETLRLPLGAIRVKIAKQMAMVLDEQGGIGKVRLDPRGDLDLVSYASLGLRDAFLVNNTIYAVTHAGGLVVGDVTKPAREWQALSLSYRATALAGSKAWLAIASEDGGIHLYTEPVVNAAPIATFSLGEPIHALATDGHILYVAAADNNVIALDVNDIWHPVLAGKYPARNIPSALLFHERYIYGSGNYLWALSPLPRVTTTVTAPNSWELALPPTLPEGSYHLHFHGEGVEKFQSNAVTVISPLRRSPVLQNATH